MVGCARAIEKRALSPPPVLRGRVRVGVRASGAPSTQPPPLPSPGVPEEGVRSLVMKRLSKLQVESAIHLQSASQNQKLETQNRKHMGPTIHYSLRSRVPDAASARKLIEQLHRKARDLPFQ